MMLTQIVEAILNEEDVEGLLAVGAPHDEYEREAANIAKSIESLKSGELTETLLVRIVSDVVNAAFGPFNDAEFATRAPVYRRVAARVLSELRKKER